MRHLFRSISLTCAALAVAGCGVLTPPERADVPSTPARSVPTVTVAAEAPLHPVVHQAARDAGLRVRMLAPKDAARSDLAVAASATRVSAAGRARPWAESPLAVGLWEPLAQAAARADEPITFSRLPELAADARGWSIVGAPQFGRIKLLHGHPSSSPSGAMAVYGTLCAAGSSARIHDARKAVDTARRRVTRARSAQRAAPEDRRRIRATRRAESARVRAVKARTAAQARRCTASMLRRAEARSALRDLQSAIVDTPAQVTDVTERMDMIGPAYTSGVIASDVEIRALDARFTGSHLKAVTLPATRASGPLRVRYHVGVSGKLGARLLAAMSALVARDGARWGLRSLADAPVATDLLTAAVDDFGADRRPVNVAMVIDPRARDRSVLTEIAEGLTDRDRLAIIEAGARPRVRTPPKKPAEAAGALRATPRQSSTVALHDSVSAALESLRTLRDDAAANWVLVLAGGADAGSSVDAARLKELLSAQAYAEGREVRVYVLGERDATLHDAAEASGGGFVAAADALPYPLAVRRDARPGVYAPSSSTAAPRAPTTTSTP